MKRGYLLLLTIFISMISSNKAFAATGLSDAEQLILDKMKAGVEINGEQRYLPITYINQAENEFLSNKEDITVVQAAMIINKIDEATDIINEMNIDDLANIQNSEATLQLMALISEAADEVNYEVSINIADRSVNIRNKEGDIVLIAKDIVNQTGYSTNLMVVGGAIYFSTLILCIIVFLILRFVLRRERQYSMNEYNRVESIGRV